MDVVSSEQPTQTLTNPDVSVIIPSYKSAPHVRQCLDALKAQITTCSYEVILVDSSQDATHDIVAEEYPDVRLIHFDKRCSVGKARNIGVEKAKAEIVLFLDTDCVPIPTWLEQLYSALQRHHVVGVGGAIENGTPTNIMGSVGFYLEFFRFLSYKGPPCFSTFLMGGNSGFRKTVCQSLPFKDASIGDDFLFTWHLVHSGKPLLFVPSAVVRHINKTGLRKVLNYQYQLGLGACAYRQTVSPRLSSSMKRLPPAIFLSSVFVLFWIGCLVLKREKVFDGIKFFLLLPFLLLGHVVWATGFFREIMRIRKLQPHRHPQDPLMRMPHSEAGGQAKG